MKKLITTAVFLFVAIASSYGQKLMIGEKAPDLKVKEWVNEKPEQGTVRLIEFYHSSSQQACERLSELDGYAGKFGSNLTIIVIAREDRETLEKTIMSESRAYSVGIDDAGKTFSAYSVQYVPFSVLVDEKGKTVWFGNPSNLKESTISDQLK